MTAKQPVAAEERNESNIFLIRGQKVMLSLHLAEMYEVELRALDQAVERNLKCFPEASVFQLNPEEFSNLKSQLAISGMATPYAFTGLGAAVLSSILFDERAIHDDQESCAPTCSCRR